MPRRRSQLLPWKAAGTRTESRPSADEVVRETGWVFNNRTGSSLTLAEFVATGDREVARYLRECGVAPDRAGLTLVEIGSGIGRMTSAFTREFGSVVATDVDAAFLERCRETVARHGRPSSLRTRHIVDGRTIPLADASADVVFSYITLQHCSVADALSLTLEALRIVKPGGQVLLNYRSWVPADLVLLPIAGIMRMAWRAPMIGGRLSRWRWSTRLGWQANRLNPREVLAHLEASGVELDDIVVRHHPLRVQAEALWRGIVVDQRGLVSANKSHWWLSARRR
jgi:SAM-dependent methyltransferase